MPRYRKVPEDAAEASYILQLINADLKENMPSYSVDVPKLRVRLNTQARWEGIVADLTSEEPAPPKEPEKAAESSAPIPPGNPTPSADAPTSRAGGGARAAGDKAAAPPK
jgi:hypothetical protein